MAYIIGLVDEDELQDLRAAGYEVNNDESIPASGDFSAVVVYVNANVSDLLVPALCPDCRKPTVGTRDGHKCPNCGLIIKYER